METGRRLEWDDSMEMHRLAHLLWNSDAPSAEFGKAKSVELSW